GRWFRAPGFDGPWQYVAARALPGDFAKIPDDSPKENVKASIPSTPQAEDALLANQIPQMAEVDPAQTRFAPTLRGAPILTPIAGTPLLTVQNSQTPIIRVDDTHWYAVQDGVWFTAPALAGPWAVATSVPPVIYTIPPSSPLYYVTFVKIYDVTSSRVVEGYTPGYLGAVSTSDGVVVYGTGYSYPSPIIENVWYPAPVTYGYAANNCWTPWTGWIIGFGFGWTFGAEFDEHHHHRPWGWGPAPYWGAHFHRFVGPGRRGPGWGPNRWTATGVDVYRHWGRTPGTRSPSGFNAWGGNAWSNRVGHAYNSTTGHVAAGERVPVTNVYTGNFAYRNRGRTTAPATPPRGQQPPGGGVFTDRNGSIYRSSNNRIQQFNNGQWRNVPDQQRVQTLRSQQQWSLRAGDQRAAGSSWSGAWGNNFRPGAGRPSGGSQWNGGQFGSSRGNLGSFHGGRTGSSPRGGGGSGSARGGGGRR
ncbi:MAG TPA: autotransporter, partial [Armatimonadota bacterium]